MPAYCIRPRSVSATGVAVALADAGAAAGRAAPRASRAANWGLLANTKVTQWRVENPQGSYSCTVSDTAMASLTGSLGCVSPGDRNDHAFQLPVHARPARLHRVPGEGASGARGADQERGRSEVRRVGHSRTAGARRQIPAGDLREHQGLDEFRWSPTCMRASSGSASASAWRPATSRRSSRNARRGRPIRSTR